jgi:hypothetical protein
MKPDLERALGLAHGLQAEYLLMAATAEEKQVKQIFESMAEDVDRHIKVLRSRQDYIQKWGDQLQQQGRQPWQNAQQGQNGQQGQNSQQGQNGQQGQNSQQGQNGQQGQNPPPWQDSQQQQSTCNTQSPNGGQAQGSSGGQ